MASSSSVVIVSAPAPSSGNRPSDTNAPPPLARSTVVVVVLVSVLVHELGHAYHNLCEQDRTSLQVSGTPMTLAETASTFCETILRKAALKTVTPAEQLTIIEGALQGAAAPYGGSHRLRSSAATADGPGSFAVALLDTLASTTPEDLTDKADLA